MHALVSFRSSAIMNICTILHFIGHLIASVSTLT